MPVSHSQVRLQTPALVLSLKLTTVLCAGQSVRRVEWPSHTRSCPERFPKLPLFISDLVSGLRDDVRGISYKPFRARAID
jgi:hypothetical protein